MVALEHKVPLSLLTPQQLRQKIKKAVIQRSERVIPLVEECAKPSFPSHRASTRKLNCSRNYSFSTMTQHEVQQSKDEDDPSPSSSSPQHDTLTMGTTDSSDNEDGGDDLSMDGIMKIDPSSSLSHPNRQRRHASRCHESLKTLAGVAGNVLEWYDFAVFGFFSDILGVVFFPKDQPEDLSVIESFAVFGGAFLMRPVGGLVIGYYGDVYGRKYALELSIFLMAVATTCMGLLPTYNQIGGLAILLLVLVRMTQGMSVGGQLMSSLVFTLEGHDPARWGLFGSFVMAAANFGTFLGGIVAFYIRDQLTEEQLIAWGWRIPFLSGILISLCGIYLKYFCQDDEICVHGGGGPVESKGRGVHVTIPTTERDDVMSTAEVVEPPAPKANPLKIAFSRENRRNLIASAMVPTLWSGGFYLCFVWMAIYMTDFLDPPIEEGFGVNSISLLLIGMWFPFAGWLSDRTGRRPIMTVGAFLVGYLGPVWITLISEANGDPFKAFIYQNCLGLSLACFGSPMCAWLVEAFDPAARLTSVAIGYNLAQAFAGGLTPVLATFSVAALGPRAPGIILATFGTVSLIGLWKVAPPLPMDLRQEKVAVDDNDNDDEEATGSEKEDRNPTHFTDDIYDPDHEPETELQLHEMM